MPFVKEKFTVPRRMPAFLFMMKQFQFSQGEAQRALAKGRILINGHSIFNTGEDIEGEIEVVYFKPHSQGNPPLFHTPDFMVFEKESGTLVHPNTMATPYSMLDEIRTIAGDHANAVHRIDMETSGLLLASKHKKAETALKNLFEKRTIQKSYLAWVEGELTEPFSVTQPIRINSDYSQCKHKVSISSTGKPSHTDFIPLEYDPILDATLIQCMPHTGRTHQIRIHLFHMKHPILGDPIYGSSFATSDAYLEGRLNPIQRLEGTGASRLMLHAYGLTFHYRNPFVIQSRSDFGAMRTLIHPKELRRFNQSDAVAP